MTNEVQIYHDSFGRAALMRQRTVGGTCGWCGQPAKYTYRWVGDAANRAIMIRNPPAFCSVGCYRAFYNE